MIMDYEKLYKEALERAKEFVCIDNIEVAEYIFPELNKLGDEKIRKALLRFHKSTIDIDGIKGEDILAWLEKQREHDKPAWSEEDETYLEHIITSIKNYYKDDKGEENPFREPLLSWLKSLRPQSQWKPSGEHPNTAWHSENIVPKYNLNGITDFIVSSCHGHIVGEAHTYTPQQWSAHLGFNANRDFRWAYEEDLIDFD